jgi:predicted nucleotidyltransferase
VPIFTPDERERLRDELVSAAQNDSNLCGAAHTGSAATSRLDRWSDIDLALCLNPEASHERVVSEWTDRLYRQHGAVAHVDVMRGAILFRVFLLKNTLQVDVAFWNAQEFGAIGPNFRLLFLREGTEARPPRAPAQPDSHVLIGMAWLYALHVRSSLARGRVLQAEYMLSGMRNYVLELSCLRCGVIASQGRGLDDLPAPERETAAACLPRSLDPSELKRAFQNTMRRLLQEIGHVDGELEARLTGPLNALLG